MREAARGQGIGKALLSRLARHRGRAWLGPRGMGRARLERSGDWILQAAGRHASRRLAHLPPDRRCARAARRTRHQLPAPAKPFAPRTNGQTIIGRPVTLRPARRARRLHRRRRRPRPPGAPAGGSGRQRLRARHVRRRLGRRAARSRAGAVSQLRAVGHHRARAARRARRAEAGAAPHPLHDVAAEPHGRREAPQVREGRRRRDGQLPSARRLGDLRDARAHGAVVLAALPARRRLGQLRLARRRRRGGDAVHRVPPRAPQRRDARGDRPVHGALPSELRRHEVGAGGAARAGAEPARQRRDRHRRRHGDEHPAAQPRRGLHGADQAAGQPGPHARRSCAAG